MGAHTEIELKVRIGDYGACRKALEEIAGEGRVFAKDDAYWFQAGDGERLFPEGFPMSGIRVRQEELDGIKSVFVTRKVKEIRNGIEVNGEKEFSVSDAALCRELLEILGLTVRTAKRKAGWAWDIEGIRAELCEVSGCSGAAGQAEIVFLGWFLELEILAADGAKKTAAGAKNRLLSLLRKAGIGEAGIETRYYSELLAQGYTVR